MLKFFSIWLSKQRWLPYKTRRSVIKRTCPAMLKDFAFETEYFGLKFRGNIVNYIDRLIYFCGGHEKYMLRLLTGYARRIKHETGKNITFMDVGANAGNHTLVMSKDVKQVYAFEPFARVRAQLEENLKLNNISNVKVFDFGLSNENATLPFYAGPEANLGAASFQAAHKSDNTYLGDMQIKRGDDIVAQHNITIDILKADVEGFEKFVLQGLAQTLKRDRPLCIIELSPTTRKTLESSEALYALFPEQYAFYYFAWGSNNTGYYMLAPFHYARESKIQDVIACPKEKLGFLSD
jgi:FkbM family methyltransferase